MRVFVTGVGGQLGHDVMNELHKRGHEGIGSDIAPQYSGAQDGSAVTVMPYMPLDITDAAAVSRVLREVKPDAVVHCAAWTAVDAAEDMENQSRVHAINAEGTANIAEVCKELDCKMVVVACNTATAAAIGFLREKYAGMPIVGMEPAVKPACLATRSGVVGVLATERSLDGELFRRTAARYGSGIEVLTYPGTGFVELVEGDREDTPEAEGAVRAAVEPMLARGADQIVLGCTHYPFLTPVMERIVDGRAAIVDPSPAVARRVGQLLDRYGLRASADNRPALTFRTFADELYRLRLERKVAAYL